MLHKPVRLGKRAGAGIAGPPTRRAAEPAAIIEFTSSPPWGRQSGMIVAPRLNGRPGPADGSMPRRTPPDPEAGSGPGTLRVRNRRNTPDAPERPPARGDRAPSPPRSGSPAP